MNKSKTLKRSGLRELISSKVPKGMKYSKKSMYEAFGMNSRRFDVIMNDITILTLKEAQVIATYFCVEVSEVVKLKNT